MSDIEDEPMLNGEDVDEDPEHEHGEQGSSEQPRKDKRREYDDEEEEEEEDEEEEDDDEDEEEEEEDAGADRGKKRAKVRDTLHNCGMHSAWYSIGTSDLP